MGPRKMGYRIGKMQSWVGLMLILSVDSGAQLGGRKLLLFYDVWIWAAVLKCRGIGYQVFSSFGNANR